MQGKIFPIILLDLYRESSTSLIDAAFIKLTSDNDERTERTGKIKSLLTKSQRKKEEQNAKKKKKKGGRIEERSQV